MPDVFTFYCHGTGAARDHNVNTEIVNFFAHQRLAQEYISMLILDGVGKAPKAAGHYMAGEFVYNATLGPTFKEKVTSKSPTFAQMNGSGVKCNINFAMEIFENQIPTHTVKTVNMIGWSRGAVTCIRLANKLVTKWPNLNINIFAVDPVVGGDKGFDEAKPDNKNIPAQVKNLLVILATGEKRTSFTPQDASLLNAPASTNAIFLPMSGVHDTVAKVGTGNLTHVSNVVFSMAGQFLEKFGTTPAKAGNLKDIEYLEQYSQMMLNSAEYATIRSSKGVGIKIQDRFTTKLFNFHRRDFVKALESYVMNPDFFINLHHRRCFKSVFPQLFTYLFKSNKNALDMKKVNQEYEASKQLPGLSQQLLSLAQTPDEKVDQETEFFLVQQTAMDAGKPERIKYRGSLNKMGILQNNDAKPDDSST